MRIVKVKGGLGNQMFQYAFAYLLMQKTNDIVKLDLQTYKDLIDDPIRRPRILKFNTSLSIASHKDISDICVFNHSGNMLSKSYKIAIVAESLVNKYYFFEKDRRYRNINTLLNYNYYDGYWQSWRHIDKIWSRLRCDFKPKIKLHTSTIDMINKVSSENSVFVGIRRGDYQERKRHYGTYGQDYYTKAIRIIKEKVDNPVFYVFSNDVPWVKNNIIFPECVVNYRESVDIIDDFEDLLIMAACKHAIIINSTYHWWGARLNEYKGKVIVAPQKWFWDNKPIDIVPNRWIKI